MFWDNTAELIEEYSKKIYELYNVNREFYVSDEEIDSELLNIFTEKIIMNLQYIIDSDKTILECDELQKRIYMLENTDSVFSTDTQEKIIFYSALYDIVEYMSKDDIRSLSNGEQLRQIIGKED